MITHDARLLKQWIVWIVAIQLSTVEATVTTSCDIPSIDEGQQTKLTCMFSEDISRAQVDFKVELYSLERESTSVPVLDCVWFNGKLDCRVHSCCSFDRKVTDNATLIILNATQDLVGKYMCHVVPSSPGSSHFCYFTLNKIVSTGRPEALGTDGVESNSSPVVPVVVGVVVSVAVVVIAIIVIVYLCRKRRYRNVLSDNIPKEDKSSESEDSQRQRLTIEEPALEERKSEVYPLLEKSVSVYSDTTDSNTVLDIVDEKYPKETRGFVQKSTNIPGPLTDSADEHVIETRNITTNLKYNDGKDYSKDSTAEIRQNRFQDGQQSEKMTEAKHYDTTNTETEVKYSDTTNSETEGNHSDTTISETEAKHSDTTNSETEAKHSDTTNSETEAKHSDTTNSETEAKHSDTTNSETEEINLAIDTKWSPKENEKGSFLQEATNSQGDLNDSHSASMKPDSENCTPCLPNLDEGARAVPDKAEMDSHNTPSQTLPFGDANPTIKEESTVTDKDIRLCSLAAQDPLVNATNGNHTEISENTEVWRLAAIDKLAKMFDFTD